MGLKNTGEGTGVATNPEGSEAEVARLEAEEAERKAALDTPPVTVPKE